jgi:hypothetical protein
VQYEWHKVPYLVTDFDLMIFTSDSFEHLPIQQIVEWRHVRKKGSGGREE